MKSSCSLRRIGRVGLAVSARGHGGLPPVAQRGGRGGGGGGGPLGGDGLNLLLLVGAAAAIGRGSHRLWWCHSLTRCYLPFDLHVGISSMRSNFPILICLVYSSMMCIL